MSIAYFDDYLSEIETDDQILADPADTEKLDELEREANMAAKRRKAIEYYQERKRLRNDLEYFS